MICSYHRGIWHKAYWTWRNIYIRWQTAMHSGLEKLHDDWLKMVHVRNLVRLDQIQACEEDTTCDMESNSRGIKAIEDEPGKTCNWLSPLLFVTRVCIPPPRWRTLELVGQMVMDVCVDTLSDAPKRFAMHPTSPSPPHLSPNTSHVTCYIVQTGASSLSHSNLVFDFKYTVSAPPTP